jgi:hypothetical protein
MRTDSSGKTSSTFVSLSPYFVFAEVRCAVCRSLGGFWWAAIPKEHWPDIQQVRESIDKVWNPEVGDCRQELVFIGIDMDDLEIYDSLQACLLTDEELALGPAAWASFPDPFPKWNRTVDDLLASLESESTSQ